MDRAGCAGGGVLDPLVRVDEERRRRRNRACPRSNVATKCLLKLKGSGNGTVRDEERLP